MSFLGGLSERGAAGAHLCSSGERGLRKLAPGFLLTPLHVPFPLADSALYFFTTVLEWLLADRLSQEQSVGPPARPNISKIKERQDQKRTEKWARGTRHNTEM